MNLSGKELKWALGTAGTVIAALFGISFYRQYKDDQREKIRLQKETKRLEKIVKKQQKHVIFEDWALDGSEYDDNGRKLKKKSKKDDDFRVLCYDSNDGMALQSELSSESDEEEQADTPRRRLQREKAYKNKVVISKNNFAGATQEELEERSKKEAATEFLKNIKDTKMKMVLADSVSTMKMIKQKKYKEDLEEYSTNVSMHKQSPRPPRSMAVMSRDDSDGGSEFRAFANQRGKRPGLESQPTRSRRGSVCSSNMGVHARDLEKKSNTVFFDIFSLYAQNFMKEGNNNANN